MSQLTNSRPRGFLALPYDVECAILDQLSHDFVALEACSLVCRGWTRIAQQRLFRSILINIPHHWVKNGYNENVLEDFRQVLRESRHLAKFIHTIRIDGGRCRIPRLVSFVRHMLRRASHLHTMTLSAMLVKPGPDVVSNTPPRASIDTLNLWGLCFTKPDALLRILSNFTHIGQLYICKCEEISGNATEPDFSVSPSTVPVVESVALVDVPGMSLLKLLQSVLCMSSLDDGALTSMDISIAKPSAVSIFLLPCLEYARNHILALDLDVHRRMFQEHPGEYLDRTRIQATNSNSSDTSRMLTPIMPHAENFAESWDELASCIASCTALEFLGFSVEGHEGREDQGFYARYVQTFLESYVCLLCSLPPTMRSIEFTVRQRSAVGAGTVQAILGAVAGGKRQWGALDAALSTSPVLTRFAFIFNHSEGGHTAEADRARVLNALKGALSQTVAKDVSVVVELTSNS